MSDHAETTPHQEITSQPNARQDALPITAGQVKALIPAGSTAWKRWLS